jgi:ribosomal protein S27E
MNGDNSTEKTDHPKLEAVEIICPKCRYTEIIYLPITDLPLCPECNTQMMISELLDEGKSY